MWEKDLDAAWAAIHQGICARNLLIALAAKLEEEFDRELFDEAFDGLKAKYPAVRPRMPLTGCGPVAT